MLDWDDLTSDQQTLLLTGNPDRDFGCEQVDFTTLAVIADLSGYLAAGGDVQEDITQTVHRTCDITLACPVDDPFPWSSGLLRLFATLTVEGLSARRDLGVFSLAWPDQALGPVVDVDGVDCLEYQVQGQDRLCLLNRPVGRSYQVASGTHVLTAVAQVVEDAGLPAGLLVVDATKASSTVPTAMAWPLLASATSTDDTGAAAALPSYLPSWLPAGAVPDLSGTTTTATSTAAVTYALPGDIGGSTDSSPSTDTTWLTIINDLLALINYRSLYCDEDGYYVAQPYVDPTLQAADWTFNADDDESIVAMPRTLSRSAPPNSYNFIWANMPADGDGNQQTPTTSNGGLYVKQNTSTGPWSTEARNGLEYWTSVQITASSTDDLQAQGDAQYNADLSLVASIKISTTGWPAAGHGDIVDYVDSSLPSDVGSPLHLQALQWQCNLDGSDSTWTLGIPVYSPVSTSKTVGAKVASTSPWKVTFDGDQTNQIPAGFIGDISSLEVGDRVQVTAWNRGGRPIIQGALT